MTDRYREAIRAAERARAMAAHPAGPLTPASIEARRRALHLEQRATDRALAALGGIAGGVLVTATAVLLDAYAARLRRQAHR